MYSELKSHKDLVRRQGDGKVVVGDVKIKKSETVQIRAKFARMKKTILSIIWQALKVECWGGSLLRNGH